MKSRSQMYFSMLLYKGVGEHSFGMLTLIFGGYPAQAVKKLASCFATVCCDGEC
jgi:hypothetical protein